MRDLVIGLDSSTTAVKALVWDRHGALVSEGRSGYSLLRPRPAWHEQDASLWWQAACQALHDALQPVDTRHLAGLCITHQRETFVPVGEDGSPLCNGIVWLDERARTLLPEIETGFGGERFHRLTGKPLSSNLAPGKIAWLKHNSPQVFEQAARYLDVHAFLVHHLTGEYRTGSGCADPLGLFDMPAHCWAVDLLDYLGLRLDQLPQVHSAGEIIGQVSELAAQECGLPDGLPVICGIGDGQAAALGANASQPGEAYLNLGTAVVSGVYSDRYLVDRAFRTTYGALPGTYLLETVLLGGAYTVQWFLDQFARTEWSSLGSSAQTALEAAASQVPPGAAGLLLLPYWNTAMSPYWDASASGVVVGWRGIHNQAHFYRAILEGVAFEQGLFTGGVESALGEKIERFIVVGGGARSDLWCQIIADVTGKSVQRAATAEATALGAGVLAAAGCGLFAGIHQAAQAMGARHTEVFEPAPERNKIYTQLYEEVYRQLYPVLQPLLCRLADLVEEHTADFPSELQSG